MATQARSAPVADPGTAFDAAPDTACDAAFNPGFHADFDPAFDLVHARLLAGFADLAGALGGDADALLTAAGLTRGDLAAPRLRYHQHLELLTGAAATLACPDFGMRLALRQGEARIEETFGPLGRTMRHARTFGDALAFVVGHDFAHSAAARVWLGPTADPDRMFVGHDILQGRAADRPQGIEQVLLLGHLIAARLTGGMARARRVHFRHQPLAAPATYRRNFGCEVRFDASVDGIEFHRHDLAAPIHDPDAREFSALTDVITREFAQARPPLHAEARGLVMRLVGQDRCTNAEVAALLGIHPRTFHRRLAGEGTSFQRIKDEVRRDLLGYYLARTSLDLSTISERLGFAEQSVLSRSCRRWFGASPSDLRRQAH